MNGNDRSVFHTAGFREILLDYHTKWLFPGLTLNLFFSCWIQFKCKTHGLYKTLTLYWHFYNSTIQATCKYLLLWNWIKSSNPPGFTYITNMWLYFPAPRDHSLQSLHYQFDNIVRFPARKRRTDNRVRETNDKMTSYFSYWRWLF